MDNARDKTGQNTDNTDKGHSSSPRIEIKIPNLAENRSRAAGLEGRDSADHTTIMD